MSDGRFVETTNTLIETDDDTGKRITLPGHAHTYGWTPDGRLIRVDGTKVTTCDASSGECTSTTVPAGKGAVRMANRYLVS